jgi:WD40 repeat protein
MLPDGRLASASHDRTIRLWAIDTAAEAACLEVDGPVNCLIALPNGCLVAGHKFGYLHWLNVVD